MIKKLLIVVFVFFTSITFSQDLDNITKKDVLKVSGGLGVQTTSYTAIGAPAQRDPFLWQMNLNLNFDILGIISAPFSATISSQQSQLSTPQPFNNFGISPKYKAVTAHLGYRSINLSEFSLNGSQFLGVGLEIAPKDAFVKGKALYGRFSKPVFFNPNGTIATAPSFARFGWGAGITLGRSSKNEVGINVFKAKDDPNSLDIPEQDLPITPEENLVFGFTTKQQITKQINFEGEIDFSFFTNNTNLSEEVIPGNSYINNLFLFDYNPSSGVKKAIVASVNYKPKFAKFALNYRRVDPEYKTLGAAFINNDYEDLSLKTSFGLLDKKLAFTASGGLQRNNLNQEKVSRLLRLIGSVGVNYNINDKWNASINLSNFSSSTSQTIVVDIDSLRFVQTTKSAGFNVSRTVSTDKSSNSFSASLNYQDAIVNQLRTTTFYNGNLGWQKQFLGSKFGIGTALVVMHNIAETSTNSNIGPSLNMTKALLKGKAQLNLGAAYLSSFTDNVSSGSIVNIALTGSYTLLKKHKFGFSATDIIKVSSSTGNISEITATINYGYSF